MVAFPFYAAFSSTLKHTEYLHEATFRNQKIREKTFLQTEGQHPACIITEVVKILKLVYKREKS